MGDAAKRYHEPAELLKALAHPLRLCIVRGLIETNGCNVTQMQECMQAPQSTISQQLQKLKATGIVAGIRSGLEVHYHVCDSRVLELMKILFAEEKNSND